MSVLTRSVQKRQVTIGNITMDTLGRTQEMTWKWKMWNAYLWLQLPLPQQRQLLLLPSPPQPIQVTS